ncbi:MAG TPA: NADP oxidoreductase [Armatimonadota bacterium]|jgi:NAD-reducing hydrogenase small subunit
MSKTRLATVWLDGCSGCHMSLLDMDERIVPIAGAVDLVYGPLVDLKEYPENVDVALVEGAVSSDEDREKILKVRARTKILVALGDCAVTSNVPSMRNPLDTDRMLHQIYGDGCTPHGEGVPELLPRARPIHEFVTVDVYVPGCPPSADTIHQAVADLLAGIEPDLKARFG